MSSMRRKFSFQMKIWTLISQGEEGLWRLASTMASIPARARS
jgi:hypothetical protein